MTAPSQVSQPDLSFTEFSQELIRKADKIAQRVDVMVGRVNAHRAETTPASASAPTTQSPTAMQYRAPASGKLSRIRLDKLARMHTFLERRSSVQVSSSDEGSESSDSGSDYTDSEDEKGAQLRGASGRHAILRLGRRPMRHINRSRKIPVRRGVVETSTDSPIRVDLLVKWATNTANLERVGGILQQYPVLFKEKFLAQKNPTVVLQRPQAQQFLYALVIPRDLLARMNSALQQWLDLEDYDQFEVSDGTSSFHIPVAFISSDLAGLAL
jgi:hypothetical protein